MSRNQLKKFDLYRKLPEDLQLGSTTGVCASFLAVLFMIILFHLEFNSYVNIKTRSSVIIDSHQEDLLRINFNLSVPSIPCVYASVDVTDHMGQKFLNVTQNIRKWRLSTDNGVLRRLEEVNPVVPTYVHHHHPGEQISTILTTATFDEFMNKYEMVLVNFYAPWCPFCRMLEPVWEHVAGLLQERPEYAEQVKLAKVDCTKEDSIQLCRRAFIHAFPTILIYLYGKTHTRYMYNGPRSPPALMLFIDIFYKKTHLNAEVLGGRRLEAVSKDDELHPDDISQSNVASHAPEGCQISGSLNMKRVPGTFLITAHSTGHSFDLTAVNVSHIVHHLVFGSPDVVRLGESTHLPHIIENHAPLDNKTFYVDNANLTIEHYLKIVGIDRIIGGRPKRSYRFSVNSNQYNATDQMPAVRFTHDISPLAIEIRDEIVPLYQFLTTLCAIIGGMFTVLGLIDSGVTNTLHTLRKKQEIGKLH